MRASTVERTTEVKRKPMVVVPKRHNNAGKLFVRSKPTAVTANKGVDIVGELIIITK